MVVSFGRNWDQQQLLSFNVFFGKLSLENKALIRVKYRQFYVIIYKLTCKNNMGWTIDR